MSLEITSDVMDGLPVYQDLTKEFLQSALQTALQFRPRLCPAYMEHIRVNQTNLLNRFVIPSSTDEYVKFLIWFSILAIGFVLLCICAYYIETILEALDHMRRRSTTTQMVAVGHEQHYRFASVQTNANQSVHQFQFHQSNSASIDTSSSPSSNSCNKWITCLVVVAIGVFVAYVCQQAFATPLEGETVGGHWLKIILSFFAGASVQQATPQFSITQIAGGFLLGCVTTWLTAVKGVFCCSTSRVKARRSAMKNKNKSVKFDNVD